MQLSFYWRYPGAAAIDAAAPHRGLTRRSGVQPFKNSLGNWEPIRGSINEAPARGSLLPVLRILFHVKQERTASTAPHFGMLLRPGFEILVSAAGVCQPASLSYVMHPDCRRLVVSENATEADTG